MKIYENIDVFSEQEIFENEWFFEIFDSVINDAVKENHDLIHIIEKLLENYEDITFEEQDTGFEKMYMFCVYFENTKSKKISINQAKTQYIKIIYNIEKDKNFNLN